MAKLDDWSRDDLIHHLHQEMGDQRKFNGWSRDDLIHEIRLKVQRDTLLFFARYKPVNQAKKFTWLYYQKVAAQDPDVDILAVAECIQRRIDQRRSVKTIQNWIAEIPKEKGRGRPKKFPD